MSQMIPFEFHGKHVRVEMDEGGNPWWVLSDCTSVLGLANARDVVKRLDPDDVEKTYVTDALGRQQETWRINESGLYTLLLRSNKPEAKEFRRWVTSEVLPTIRQTGSYVPQPSAVDRFPELKAMLDLMQTTTQLVHGLAEARVIAEEAQLHAAQAEAKADIAMRQQQWLTIREYVYLHKLQRQFPEHLWVECGRYLTGYCLEQGIPVRQQGVADRRYGTEHAYHVEIMHNLLPSWLQRHQGQIPLTIIRERPEA